MGVANVGVANVGVSAAVSLSPCPCPLSTCPPSPRPPGDSPPDSELLGHDSLNCGESTLEIFTGTTSTSQCKSVLSAVECEPPGGRGLAGLMQVCRVVQEDRKIAWNKESGARGQEDRMEQGVY